MFFVGYWFSGNLGSPLVESVTAGATKQCLKHLKLYMITSVPSVARCPGARRGVPEASPIGARQASARAVKQARPKAALTMEWDWDSSHTGVVDVI